MLWMISVISSSNKLCFFHISAILVGGNTYFLFPSYYSVLASSSITSFNPRLFLLTFLLFGISFKQLKSSTALPFYLIPPLQEVPYLCQRSFVKKLLRQQHYTDFNLPGNIMNMEWNVSIFIFILILIFCVNLV